MTALPLKFSLLGFKGLAVIAAGYPQSIQVACETVAGENDVEQTVAPGFSTLSYSADSDQYTYAWKTSKTWAGTCRKLVVQLSDGTVHEALFKLN